MHTYISYHGLLGV